MLNNPEESVFQNMPYIEASAEQEQNYEAQEPISEPISEQAVEPAEEAATRSSKEENFRVLREQNEFLKKQLEQQLAWQQQQQQLYSNQTQQPKQKEPEYNFEVDDNDYIDGKKHKQHISHLKSEFRREFDQMREELNNTYQASALTTAELRLKAEHPDFARIVNPENLKKLQELYPSSFETLKRSTTHYDQGKTAYEMLKAYSGILANYQVQDNKIQQNLSKPKTAKTIAPSSSPLVNINADGRIILTDKDKDRWEAEMRQFRR